MTTTTPLWHTTKNQQQITPQNKKHSKQSYISPTTKKVLRPKTISKIQKK